MSESGEAHSAARLSAEFNCLLIKVSKDVRVFFKEYKQGSLKLDRLCVSSFASSVFVFKFE